MTKDVKKMTLFANLLAIAIILNVLESFITIIPVPGAKIGLANIVTLMILVMYGPKESIYFVILRVFLVAILTGKLLNVIFYMSMAGGLFASIGMAAIFKSQFFSMIGVSVIGSVAHTIGQILMAMIILSTVTVVSYVPSMLLFSVPAGIVTGMISIRFIRAIKSVNVS
ncbi:MAG: Gx transporter family protein [Acholeplasmataceae bacterium]